jgi:hypothetical protein
MKIKILSGLTLFLAVGCHEAVSPLSNSQTKERKVTVEVKQEEVIDNITTEQMPAIQVETAPVAASPVPVPVPVATPVVKDFDVIDMRYARTVFDDNSDIPPWRANYVGSYGVLPSRYAAEGPYLYSVRKTVDDDY